MFQIYLDLSLLESDEDSLGSLLLPILTLPILLLLSLIEGLLFYLLYALKMKTHSRNTL